MSLFIRLMAEVLARLRAGEANARGLCNLFSVNFCHIPADHKAFDGKLWAGFEPSLHGLKRDAAKRGLRQLMIVQVHVAMQGRPQVLAPPEVMGLQDVADAAIEAFHHAIGLRRPTLGQTMLDAQGLAELVELVRAARLTVPGAKHLPL